MMSVDILPTALPLEASTHFSNVLTPYLKSLIRGYRTPGAPHLNGNVDLKLAGALERATVAEGGELRPAHKWLYGTLSKWKEGVEAEKLNALVNAEGGSGSRPGVKKRVLMLGSGMVAKPTVDELCTASDIELIVASNDLAEAERLTTLHTSAKAVSIDVSDWSKVDSLIKESDLVISLLPVPFHPQVAQACISHRKHLVTASYISPAMKEHHDAAVDADVVLLNEIGLDPGIDHCSAMDMINNIRASNKHIRSFVSFCGGVPAPESADVPLKYKFSWSPKGVLTAGLNSATFKLNDKVETIEGKNLFRQFFSNLEVTDVLKLEGLANRNSLPYADTYGLNLDETRTVFRGTLRYEGFSILMSCFKLFGFLDTESRILPTDWLDFTTQVMSKRLDGQKVGRQLEEFSPAFWDIYERREGPKEHLRDDPAAFQEALEWLGLFPTSGQNAAPPLALLPKKPTAPIDIFASLLAHKLRYLPHERDMVVLSHEIAVDGPQQGSHEVHSSTLVVTGSQESSAMSRCVGLPVAFAVRAVLDGKVKARGVQGPTAEKSVYRTVLNELERVGLGMKEHVRTYPGGGEYGPVERTLLAERERVRQLIP